MRQTQLAKMLGVKAHTIQNRCFSSNRETRIIFRAFLKLDENIAKELLQDEMTLNLKSIISREL